MTVAAANKRWIPRLFGSVGEIGTWKVRKDGEGDVTEEAMDKGESPM